jgi:hypothetical protein
MALKDLIASRQQLNEAAIEAVIKDFVRYDPDNSDIILTPAAVRLPNKHKVLTYLVALEGWVYLKPNIEVTGARPSELEGALGIPGGTLRPLLRDLAAERLVKSDRGAYRIVAPNLDAAVAAINHQADARSGTQERAPIRRKAKSSSGRTISPRRDDTANKRSAPKRSKTSGINAAAMFQTWIDRGFFSQPKSMKDMLDEFHKKGVIMKMTSLSKLPLAAVRSGALERNKGDQEGKQVWLYSSGE